MVSVGAPGRLTEPAPLCGGRAASNRLHNRVAGGFSPPAPTTPRMRVRTGRFLRD
jgi:hypothetical protein